MTFYLLFHIALLHQHLYVCRYNKYIKNLVPDLYQAEVHLSGKVTVDSACYYDQLAQHQVGFICDRLHQCLLTSPLLRERATIEDLDDVIHLGSNVTNQDELTVITSPSFWGNISDQTTGTSGTSRDVVLL